MYSKLRTHGLKDVSKKLFLLEEQTMRLLSGLVPKTDNWELKYSFGYEAKQASIRADRMRQRFLEIGGSRKELKQKEHIFTIYKNIYFSIKSSSEMAECLYVQIIPYLRSLYLEVTNGLDQMWDHLLFEDATLNLDSINKTLQNRSVNEARKSADFINDIRSWLESPHEDEPFLSENEQDDKPYPDFFKELLVANRDVRMEHVDSNQYKPELKTEAEAKQLFLHGIADTEMHAAEICGRNIFEFPNMPWKFYMDMARQLDDEVRHANLAVKLLESNGGKFGDYPVIEGQYAYRITKHLLHRLGDMNLYSEKLAMIRAKNRRKQLLERGDIHTADFFDQVMLEEAVHVRIGYDWVNYLLRGSKEEMVKLMEETAIQRGKIDFTLLQRFGARMLNLSDSYQKKV